MKDNQPTNTTRSSLQGEVVHFEFTHPGARTVGVAGAFNKWRPDVTPMMHWGHGRWMAELLLVPGAYEYCLVLRSEKVVRDET